MKKITSLELFFEVVKICCLNSGYEAVAGDLFKLHFGYVGSLRPFSAVDDVEGNFLTFVERLETVALNRAVMNKDIFAVVNCDEAVAFAFVKPLYGTLCHKKSLLINIKKSISFVETLIEAQQQMKILNVRR